MPVNKFVIILRSTQGKGGPWSRRAIPTIVSVPLQISGGGNVVRVFLSEGSRLTFYPSGSEGNSFTYGVAGSPICFEACGVNSLSPGMFGQSEASVRRYI